MLPLGCVVAQQKHSASMLECSVVLISVAVQAAPALSVEKKFSGFSLVASPEDNLPKAFTTRCAHGDSRLVLISRMFSHVLMTAMTPHLSRGVNCSARLFIALYNFMVLTAPGTTCQYAIVPPSSMADWPSTSE
ncbi:hypothetical protein BDZ89DRAFT_1071708 [Hymenopellis radicata]|nr:hypothetical protein BDZ89DRAFT_1071708 [Hymenopellis radicata]